MGGYVIKKLGVIFILSVLATHASHAQSVTQPATEEVRNLTTTVSDRTLTEWRDAWTEFKKLSNSLGVDDGTNLAALLYGSCDANARDYWDPKMIWIAEHANDLHAVSKAKRVTRRFRFNLAKIFRAQTESRKHAETKWVVLDNKYSLMSKEKSAELNLQQRAEILIFLEQVVEEVVRQHIADPTDIELALNAIQFHKLGCEFSERAVEKLDEYLNDHELPLGNDRTELAMIYIFASIANSEQRKERLEGLLQMEESNRLSGTARTLVTRYLNR